MTPCDPLNLILEQTKYPDDISSSFLQRNIGRNSSFSFSAYMLRIPIPMTTSWPPFIYKIRHHTIFQSISRRRSSTEPQQKDLIGLNASLLSRLSHSIELNHKNTYHGSSAAAVDGTNAALMPRLGIVSSRPNPNPSPIAV